MKTIKTLRNFGFSLVVVSLACATAFAQQNLPATSTKQNDDPILARLDSLTHLRFFTNTAQKDNKFGYAKDSVPAYSSALVKSRMKKLDDNSPFRLLYNNQVDKYVQAYAIRGRRSTSKLLGLSEVYFPMFEETLDKYDLPLELKNLAIVESALNPLARSRAGATGLWQFMYGTGKMHNLNVTSYIDERKDPVKATEAACQYFSHLHDLYGDWNLVLAAYNAGPGNVNKAIRRSGGKMDYWAIQSFLPRETRNYVPAFIAVTYVMNYAAEHNILPRAVDVKLMHTDSVTIKRHLTLSKVSQTLSIPLSELKFLNPVYKLGEIPATAQHPCGLNLPMEYIGDFIANEKRLYNKNYTAAPVIAQGSITREVEKNHTVRSGEFLGLIAQKYKCSVSDLQRWNSLSSSKIYIGQKLEVHMVVHEAATLAAAKPDPQHTKPAATNVLDERFVYHTVAKGDTLWDIANMYEGVSVTIIKELNKGISANGLQLGQKIKIQHSGT